VAAEHEAGHVAHRYTELPGEEGPEARGVEDARHPDHALARELGGVVRDVTHRVERVGHHDHDRVG
jgi:hypothetical protein